jgi:hypothetical protein
MAKKKKPALKKVAKEMPFWPGLTRLHDKTVGCGAILLVDELAHALLAAIDIATTVIEETPTGRGDDDIRLVGQMQAARRILEWTFKESK